LFLTTLFTLCHFETKIRSIFIFGSVFVCFTGQVIFVPEWPKEEFVSLLATFCWQNYYNIIVLLKQERCNSRIFQRYLEYFLQYGKGLIWQVQCHKYQEMQFSEVKEDFDALTAQQRWFPLWPSRRPEEASRRSSVFEEMFKHLNRHQSQRAHVRIDVRTTQRNTNSREHLFAQVSEQQTGGWEQWRHHEY